MPIEERHRLHISGSKNKKASDYNCLFHKKIREYGEDNFNLIILEEVPNRENLDNREKYWIREKRSYVKWGNGYNLTTGGQKRKDNENYKDSRARFQSDEEIKELINDLKESSLSIKEISEKYSISNALVCKINNGEKYHQDDEKYPLRKKRYFLTQEVADEIIILLKENYSNVEISKKFNISPDVVSSINCGKHFKKENESYPIRKAFSKKEERANKIKTLLKEGTLNNKQIADIVGCDPSVVSNINYGKVFKDPLINYPIRPKK